MNHINSYPSVYALGHRAIRDIFDYDAAVLVEEKIDGCVTPETPILCADLVYREAGALRVGDGIIGVEKSDSRFRFCPGTITHNEEIRKPCVRVITQDRETICSEDHPFLVRGHKRPGKRTTQTEWCQSGDLCVGAEIVSLPVWSQDRTWESGYLAGMFDGEGTLVGPNGTHNTRRLAFYQKAGPEADLVEGLLRKRGFPVNRLERLRDPKWKVAVALTISGREGWLPALAFLGSVRPPRLLAKAPILWEGATTGYCHGQKIEAVEKCGQQTLAGISTSIKTYVANGLVSHNSQFSMSRGLDGELSCRSKGKDLIIDAPEKLFTQAVETAKSLDLHPGWVYRCEYLSKPKHNTLAYSRIPKWHLVVFDIATGPENYLGYADKTAECTRLGLECVPCLFEGAVDGMEVLAGLLERDSVLGGCKVEGVVVKNYAKFTPDKKFYVGKYVSEAFKEKHQGEWRKANPTKSDVVQFITSQLRTEARWNKAIQHLRDAGQLTESPRDIGPLIKEIQGDTEKEEADSVKESLFKHFWPQIQRGLIAGFPEFYKKHLAAKSFQEAA